MPMQFAASDQGALSVHLIASGLTEDIPEGYRDWAAFNGFTGQLGRALVLPDSSGALVGMGKPSDRVRKRFAVGAAIAGLPKAIYAIATEVSPGPDLDEIAMGYLLGQYSFDRYKTKSAKGAELVAPVGVDAAALVSIATSEALTRDLINTPTEDMGPDSLEGACRELAQTFGATIEVIAGDDLLKQNFPLIHTVGRAAGRTPRLIDMSWGGEGPTLPLVGKGVCFDTGGLNLKPGASMGLMKKDMGGAAAVLGLARMIIGAGLRLQLRVLIPAVENAVSGNAFRPGDIYTARNGLTVEINNTDAEGRLVLADALALGAEAKPDLMVSMATLTGAARVAVGPDIAPFFTDDEPLAAVLPQAALRVADPVWRLPFHDPYEAMIEPGIADLDNAPAGGMAGAITAALFLRRFADVPRYAHFDIYGWQRANAPARPKGGVGQGTRALFDALPGVLGDV